MGNQTKLVCDNNDVYALSATDANKGGILVVNTGEPCELNLCVEGQVISMCSVVTHDGFEEIRLPKILDKDTVIYIETAE